MHIITWLFLFEVSLLPHIQSFKGKAESIFLTLTNFTQSFQRHSNHSISLCGPIIANGNQCIQKRFGKLWGAGFDDLPNQFYGMDPFYFII